MLIDINHIYFTLGPPDPIFIILFIYNDIVHKVHRTNKQKIIIIKCIYIIQYTADIIQYCDLVRCQVIYNTVKFIF